MYKELPINKKAKANNLAGNKAEELSGQFTEKDTQMVRDHSTLVQYAFQSGYHEADALSVDKKVGQQGTPLLCGWEWQLPHQFGETHWQ